MEYYAVIKWKKLFKKKANKKKYKNIEKCIQNKAKKASMYLGILNLVFIRANNIYKLHDANIEFKIKVTNSLKQNVLTIFRAN